MIIESFTKIFERDILKIVTELNQYNDEKSIWTKQGLVTNSAGNLALHLIGNLNHFIGFALGNTGYVRTRELEFSTTFCSRDEVIKDLHVTISVVKTSLGKLNDDNLNSIFPLEYNGEKVTIAHMLMHLLTHLNYHVGQINYHRRMIGAAQ